MKIIFLLDLSRVLCAGYIMSVACLNATMYLISSFYKKKFNEPTPRAGFVIAIILSLCCALSVFVQFADEQSGTIVQYSLLILAAGASAWSSINLFFTMRKERK